MHHSDGSDMFTLPEHVVQVGVVQHEHVFVCHEDFEGIYTCNNKAEHLFTEYLFCILCGVLVQVTYQHDPFRRDYPAS